MEERRYSSYSYLTSAPDGGKWSASRPGCTLPPGKGPPVPIGQEAGWASEPVWMQRLEEKSSASVGDRTPVVQSVVNHYTDLSCPGFCYVIVVMKISVSSLINTYKNIPSFVEYVLTCCCFPSLPWPSNISFPSSNFY
jgi:hypothetical protein